MENNERYEITTKRNYRVFKANEIIQKARYELGITELKTLAYLFSMIKPTDGKFTQYTFSVKDYCQICGIDYKNGGNYDYIKTTLKTLRDKSFYLQTEDGTEETVGWLYKVYTNKGSGKIRVIFDETLQQYITGLYNNYTQYELLCTLPMRSSYSFRIYELLKSYAYTGSHKFAIDDLKSKLTATHYQNFKDFRKKVIEVAVKEINLYTDLEVSWEPVTQGRKVTHIIFSIHTQNIWERNVSRKNATEALDGQYSLFDGEYNE